RRRGRRRRRRWRCSGSSVSSVSQRGGTVHCTLEQTAGRPVWPIGNAPGGRIGAMTGGCGAGAGGDPHLLGRSRWRSVTVTAPAPGRVGGFLHKPQVRAPARPGRVVLRPFRRGRRRGDRFAFTGGVGSGRGVGLVDDLAKQRARGGGRSVPVLAGGRVAGLGR